MVMIPTRVTRLVFFIIILNTEFIATYFGSDSIGKSKFCSLAQLIAMS